eukprot:CAMPEP_0176252166 /NCGR_PEP_ID=MMETSP0121_2-20121125/35371_1 /TAXON_ID=160619 /ORGANISM="Kryptoperidinium foliaceum, Strain CCMP 1326" /LENGTH=112 /DNA_ID=CAMNT_0017591925 /DNA_START=122 /DNA_END=456 /DNA_ORIENTATION=-
MAPSSLRNESCHADQTLATRTGVVRALGAIAHVGHATTTTTTTGEATHRGNEVGPRARVVGHHRLGLVSAPHHWHLCCKAARGMPCVITCDTLPGAITTTPRAPVPMTWPFG